MMMAFEIFLAVCFTLFILEFLSVFVSFINGDDDFDLPIGG